MNPISFFAKILFWQSLQQRGPALSFARLCTSRHLQDLQWLATLVIVILVVLSYGKYLSGFDLSLLREEGVFAAIAAGAAGLLTWAYQSGSRRIGAVDLFACEISVICRVCIVVDYANSSVALAARALDRAELITKGSPGLDIPARKNNILDVRRKFTSVENYTPVYDNHLSELQPLDVNVVTYVTQFYTYRKTLVDYLRAISAEEDSERIPRLFSQMIYMQFLMFESARLAVEELIEFEPNRAESLVNILCSELVLFRFLHTEHKDDYQGARLYLRRSQYHDLVPELYNTIMRSRHGTWTRAKTTAPEMLKRYKLMCQELNLDPGV